MADKINCWDYMECGYGPDGILSKQFGECPVVTARTMDGIHGGDAGGRSCWMIKGTHCFNETQGSIISKMELCKRCEFYLHVKVEEARNFKNIPDLIHLLNPDDMIS